MANPGSKKCNNFSIYIADAFTKRPFAGNSAAVCLIPFNKEIAHDVKQKIAAEMNLSETAFLKVIQESDSFQTGKRFVLEWFTPTHQVPLCGHATLATSAVLFMECGNDSEELEFETLSGVLKAKKLISNRIELDLPAYDSIQVGDKYSKLVSSAVGTLPVADVVLSDSNKLLIRLHDSVTRKEFESFKTVDAELLAAAKDIVGVIVTLRSLDEDFVDEDGNKYDFVSRYFGPWWGISEDPVTGSAHSVLAPYWAKVLQKEKFYARQCSKRGGELHIHLMKDRVLISGDAVVNIKGQISF